MRTSSDFAAFCLDLFSGLPRVEARSMFGGHAFYVGAAMFAIGDADEWRVWLKTDGATRARFEEAGGEPFVYTDKHGRSATMSFLTVPDAAMEEAEEMLPWARLALEAAERAVAKRRAAEPPERAVKRRPKDAVGAKAGARRPAKRR